jgi:hypothetical protein
MSGFLVEIRPGRELLYRTTWALREAMRSGEITPDSRIFHRATDQWISITEHPEYRRFLTEPHPPTWVPSEAPEPGVEVPAETNGNGGRLSGLIHHLADRWSGLKRRLESAPERREQAHSRPEKQKPVYKPVSENAPPTDSPPEAPKGATPPPGTRRDSWTFFP